jgi:hypothetical protein
VGFHIAYQGDKGRGRIAFDIQLRGNQRFQQPYILIPDMALIGPGMYGDSLGPKEFTIHRHLLHIRDIPSPGIPQGGDLVDIYTESGHGKGLGEIND